MTCYSNVDKFISFVMWPGDLKIQPELPGFSIFPLGVEYIEGGPSMLPFRSLTNNVFSWQVYIYTQSNLFGCPIIIQNSLTDLPHILIAELSRTTEIFFSLGLKF